MPTLPALALLVLALLAVALLGRYALAQWRQVRRQEQQRVARQQLREQQAQDLRLSLRVLAQALLDAQVDLSEGALRLHTLLQGFALDCDSRHRLHAFSALAAAIADQPLGAARRALPAGERNRLERQRLALEDEHREAVLAAARELLVLLRTQ